MGGAVLSSSEKVVLLFFPSISGGVALVGASVPSTSVWCGAVFSLQGGAAFSSLLFFKARQGKVR